MGQLVMRHPGGVWGRWRVSVLLGALLALVAQGTAAFQTASPRLDSPALWVGFRDGRLSVEAREAPWGEVLGEVSRKTGILLHLAVPVEGSVTISFRDLPVEKALARLFRSKAGFVFLYPDHDAGLGPASPVLPAEVWLFGVERGGGDVSATAAEEGEGGLPASAILTTGDPGHQPEREFERDPRAARAAALGDPDLQTRVLAIAHLGQQADQEAVRVLLELVEDRDAHIRAGALEALGPSLASDPPVRRAPADVMGAAAEDPDVQQLAGDSLTLESGSGSPHAETARRTRKGVRHTE